MGERPRGKSRPTGVGTPGTAEMTDVSREGESERVLAAGSEEGEAGARRVI